MADNNRNWNNQFQQSNDDWEQNRNRFENKDRNRDDRYGNASYGNDYQNQNSRGRHTRDSARGREMENQGNYGGAYSSDYGYQGGGFDQTNWGSRDYDQTRQNISNQSQQWRDDEWKRRNQDFGHGQTDWGKRDVNYGGEFGGGHRNTLSDYNQGWDQTYGNSYDNDDSNRFRNTGYRERSGMTRSNSNRNYGNRGDHDRNYGNAGYDRDRGWWDRTRDEVSSWFGDDDAERRRDMDKKAGPHKGKGPKDYRRSEDRIREDVCYRLADDDMVDASDINVEIKDNEVILTGTVTSREEKRRAEDLVESVYGVQNVENRIRVNKDHDSRFERYTGTTSDASGIGRESGTTNEVIRNTTNERNRKG